MKKFLTMALATACVGLAVGVVANNSMTADAAQLVYDRESLQDPPKCILTLEESKVKNMTDWDYCLVDGEFEAWYFYGDGSATGTNNPEIRFVADGVQTTTKPYHLPAMTVGSFSFEYAIENTAPAGVVDLTMHNYIVQILGSDGLYPVIEVSVEADGDWHTITVDSNTPFYSTTGGDAKTYSEYQDKFCGFLFKMGGLDGEFMIRNIRLYDVDGAEILPEEETPDQTVTSEENESFDDDSFDIGNDNVGTFDSVTSSMPTEVVEKSKGCGSFGVGVASLSTLTLVGAVLCLKKRRK